jgi:Carboxypeptidase regulatory-like domain
MRVIVPACAAGTIGVSFWLLAALVAPGPTALPSVGQPADYGRRSGQPTGLDDVSRRYGPTGLFVLSGRVVDAGSGDAIQGADVDVLSDDNSGGATITDQRGNWTFNRLPAGRYYVTIRKAGYQIEYSGLPLISLTDARPWRVLNVALARGSVLSGRITDAGGRPAVGMDVRVLRAIPSVGGTTLQFEGDSTQADESGRFHLSGLRDGEYVLAAQGVGRLGLETSSRTQVTTFYPGTAVSTEAERFTLVAGSTRTGLRFAMQTLPTVTVWGHVVSSTGHRVPGTVTVEDRNSGTFSTTFFREGPPSSEFSVTRLTRGRYRLIGKTEGFNGVSESGSIDITVGDSDIAGLVLRTAPPTTLRGRVVAEGCESWNLNWMRLGAMPVDGSGTLDAEPAMVQRDRTFEIQTHLAPARIVAFQSLYGWEVKAVRWKGRETSDGLLSFHQGEKVSDVEVILRRRASILEGTVRDRGDCTFVIVLQRADAGKAACVASSPIRDGRFQTLPLPAGNYRIVAAHGPFPVQPETLWDMATPVTLADNQTLTLTLNARKRP